MLKIGDFSKLSRISIRMLRHYDSLGLLTPGSIDPSTGYRYYREDQLPIAERILALKEMGFGLSAIGEILQKYGDPIALCEFLSIRRSQVLEEKQQAERRLLLLESTISRLRKDKNSMNHTVIVKTLPERYVASVRKVIPSYDQEHILWNIMASETGCKLQMAEGGLSLAVFHDEGFREADVDVEIQCSVKGPYENTPNVVFKKAPAVVCASATYQGSYEQITAVNQAVANWVNDNGYAFDGPMFCIYHVSPAQTQNPEELVTEVCYPVRKR